MQIPHYSLSRDPKAWLAWRLRVWARRFEPTRPYLMGPFSAPAGTHYWVAMHGNDSVAEFNTRASPSPVDDRDIHHEEEPVPGKLTNLQLKDYATQLIERAILEIDHPAIVRWAETYVAGGAITDFDAHLVADLLDRATVTVSWSETD